MLQRASLPCTVSAFPCMMRACFLPSWSQQVVWRCTAASGVVQHCRCSCLLCATTVLVAHRMCISSMIGVLSAVLHNPRKHPASHLCGRWHRPGGCTIHAGAPAAAPLQRHYFSGDCQLAAVCCTWFHRASPTREWATCFRSQQGNHKGTSVADGLNA